jgi:HPt (histidine-containing phosphotransfer) domain-containing protein
MTRCAIKTLGIRFVGVSKRNSGAADSGNLPGTDCAHTLCVMEMNDDGLDHGIIADLTEICQHNGDDVISVLLDMYFSEMPNRLRAICESARESNFSELTRAAHRLKGSSASLGARRMAEICGELEMFAKRSQTSNPPTNLLAALEAEARRLREVLPAALGRAEGS